MRLDVMGLNHVFRHDVRTLPSPVLSEVMELYPQLSGKSKAERFQQSAIRDVGVVIDVIDVKTMSSYTPIDVGKVRDAIIAQGLAILLVTRTLITIKACTNRAIAEYDVDIRHPLSAI